MDIRIPSSYREIEDFNGSIKIIAEPSPSDFFEQVMEHVSKCKDFEQLVVGHNVKCLSIDICCNCGMKWMISLRDAEKDYAYLISMVQKGFFRSDNLEFVKIIDKMKKCDETELIKTKRIDRLKHPIFSLEVE